MFNNEIEILHTRIDYLYNIVDYFVICESKVSHSRKIIKDEFNFIKNKDIFQKYMDKIIFLPIEDYPFISYDTGNEKEWKNENYQRKYLYNGFKNAEKDDIIIISDLDEIPFDKTIKSAVMLLNNNEKLFIFVNQILFYYYVNLQKEQIWKGTYITKKKYLGYNEESIMYSIQFIRNNRCDTNNIIKDECIKNIINEYLEQFNIQNSFLYYIGDENMYGGVHYSWLNNIIKEKFMSIAEHDIISKYNNDENIKNCLIYKKDLFDRESINGKQKIVNLNEQNSLSNINKMIELYPHLIYKHESEMMISIILPYYNRIDKIKITLDSYQNFYFSHNNFEVIIVDDGSSHMHKLDNLIKNYTFNIKLINLPEKSKNTEVNPCYPYNVGVKNSIGNIIVLSSPETFHTSNMFKVTNNFNKLNDNSYLLLSTFCCTNNNIINNIVNNNFKLNNDIIKLFTSNLGEGTLNNGTKRPDFNNEYGSWYLHSIYKKSHLNFFSCLTRNLYYKLCGFDEKYRYGTGYDDNEFLNRIKNIVPINNFFYYDEAIAIHIDHEVVHNLPPTLNEQIYNENKEYIYNNEWGMTKNSKKRIGILCSFGIGGADKVTEILTREFIKKFNNNFEFILFYNDWCFPIKGDINSKNNRIINYDFCNLIKINNTSDLTNYNLDLFIVHRGGNEHWLLENFENISFDFKILEINFHGDIETKCDFRICPSEDILMNLINKGFMEKKIFLIPNPINNKLTSNKLNLEICNNKFVYGRIARSDIEIYSCVNLVAYKLIETEETIFLYINPNQQAKNDAELLNIKNIIFLDGTINSEELSKIYNTFDVYCHSNILGETFGNTIGEAISHNKPVVSHEGYSNKYYPQSHNIFFKDCEELFIKNNINSSYNYYSSEYQDHIYNYIAPEYAKNMIRLKDDLEYYNKIVNIQQKNIENFSVDNISKKYIEIFNLIL